MAKPFPLERNKEIVEKKDVQGWTFERLAKHYGRSLSTIHEAYNKTKNGDFRLSTGGV
jgi:transposase